MSLILYTYVESNPLRYIDPSGMSPNDTIAHDGSGVGTDESQIQLMNMLWEIADTKVQREELFSLFRGEMTVTFDYFDGFGGVTGRGSFGKGKNGKKSAIKDVEKVPGWTNTGGAKNYAYGTKGFKPGKTHKPSHDGTIITDVMDKSKKIKVGEIHKNQPVKNGSGGKYYPEHFQYFNHKTGKTKKIHYY